ncbi:right-handed parallel beta-helix repeat-containing protein [Agrilutibacter solisilvae]|uniref:Right-handed parallel beta-helix repeat-containing protein n=1 Tax=Agrilutibacter solisilvae TaxID=2763317 RepID=A0A975ASG4_9GAMM|nr:right-handed parallel beta-helix repeat-containing protein [Lysobacter solisilvae]QSX78727.1 right-handed parallel beta-helix repeat-containing protein [Lysobacter solisilvae]
MNLVRPALALLLAGFALFPGATRAAESYDSCAGFIDSLPVVISSQGTWCLRKDLSTAVATGFAIKIAANNVTIDCNHFKLGGLAAGDGSKTYGVYAENRQNVTVRHCNLRGFYAGVFLWRGAGHLVEDNRVDNSLGYGIFMLTDFSTSGMIRNNQVYATGGAPDHVTIPGISAVADIIDNTVDGVFSATANGAPIGIDAMGPGTEVRGNRVRGLVSGGSGTAIGLRMMADGIVATGNRFISQTPLVGGKAIHGSNYGVCQDNIASRYQFLMTSCQDGGGNVIN